MKKEFFIVIEGIDLWFKIPCLTGGKLDSATAIHRRIWDKLSPSITLVKSIT